jgi:(p)ppGpp synthase/HD superfamily hydrolase
MTEYKSMEDQLTDAIILAAKAHADQVDLLRSPYIIHPLAVMQLVAPDLPAMVVAVLHDVIEDTTVELSDLASFSPEIVNAVSMLTREPKGVANRSTYMEYIQRLAPNALARKVKLRDLEHNSLMSRVGILPPHKLGLCTRYAKAYSALKRYEKDGTFE